MRASMVCKDWGEPAVWQAAYAVRWGDGKIDVARGEGVVAVDTCAPHQSFPLFRCVTAGLDAGQAWENGRFAVEDAPRFFTYWTAADLDRALAAAGFSSVGGAMGDGTDEHQTWLSRLVQKPR